MTMNHYGVVMAGGGGTRFWPLSREKKPKQLLNLSGKGIMVNDAVDRLATIISKSNIFVVTSDALAPEMIVATQGRVFPRNILAEPLARNTTACIGYAAMEIYKKYGDGVMIVTPSDHHIKNIEELTKTFRIGLRTAEEKNKLITIGIAPTFPSTGFGYIRYEKNESILAKRVLEFKEKPDDAIAQNYIQSGDYMWNSGIFIWKASTILTKIKQFVPDVYDCLSRIGASMNTPSEQEVLHTVYSKIKEISIDYSILEPSATQGDVLMIPASFDWNDVGSWDALSTLQETDRNGNITHGDVTMINVQNSVIYSSARPITAVDVDNIIIVETEDVVMICRKDRAQNVKSLVEEIKKAGKNELL